MSIMQGNEPIANGRTYGQGQGQWSYRRGSVSNDVMGRIRSESGSESYVMMTSRGEWGRDIKGTRLSVRQYT